MLELILTLMERRTLLLLELLLDGQAEVENIGGVEPVLTLKLLEV